MRRVAGFSTDPRPQSPVPPSIGHTIGVSHGHFPGPILMAPPPLWAVKTPEFPIPVAGQVIGRLGLKLVLHARHNDADLSARLHKRGKVARVEIVGPKVRNIRQTPSSLSHTIQGSPMTAEPKPSALRGRTRP